MIIYIASSWKNQHAVEMLTGLLRDKGHTVESFVEKAVIDEGRDGIRFDIEKWINSEQGQEKFKYDTTSAMNSDLLIYIGPSGSDAWAEVGAAYAKNVLIFGLWAKGEPVGLMRLMMDHWFLDYKELLTRIDSENKRVENECPF